MLIWNYDLLALIWWLSRLVCDVKFDDDLIKNEWASTETPFSHYKSKIFAIQGQVTPKWVHVVLIWPKIKLVQAFMPTLVTSNFDDDSIKN